MNSLTGRDLHRYRLWRQEDGDLNQVFLELQIDTSRVFLRFCESIDAVEADPHSKLMSPTLSDGVGQPDVKLETDEADQLPEYLDRFEYAIFCHVLVVLLWRTGLRIGSVRALDADDPDGGNEYVSLCHRLDTDSS
jgi:hypothetical protein